MKLVFFPISDNDDVAFVEIERAATSTGTFSNIATVKAKNPYGNFNSCYEDKTPLVGENWYLIKYFKYTDKSKTTASLVETVGPVEGEEPYPVTPKMVIDVIQGIPKERVECEVVQRIIGWVAEDIENYIRMRLTPQTVVDEIYNYDVFSKILGPNTGDIIRLRHFPVQSIEGIKYTVRGAPEQREMPLNNLDIRIMNHDATRGFNRGEITVWPSQTSINSVFAGLRLARGVWEAAINVFISYTHGWAVWPGPIAKVITDGAAAFAMEIMGEAGTAGVSSRSVDGYSESYTASATTTVFSARRIFYLDEFKKQEKRYRKPLFG